MRPEDLVFWLKAQPFRPFRLVMVSGNQYEIRHPEMVKVGRTSLTIFTPADIYDRAEMIGLLLVEKIEPVETTTVAK